MLQNFVFLNKKTQRQLSAYYAAPIKLLKRPLIKEEKIAYIASPNLGDTLIGLVTVNNLLRNGYQVDVYGDYAYALRDWFSLMQVFPAVPLEQQKKLEQYSTVLHMHERDLSKELALWHPHSVVLYHNPLFCFMMSEVDIQLVVCECQLGLQDIVRTNGMQPPSFLKKHKNRKRVMIHPTSTALLKNWPPEKFMQLARALSKRGYEPNFVLAADERAEWEKIVGGEFQMPTFTSLSEVAASLYESGYFIGNDSGIGHLASSVGLPTLTIIIRTSSAIHWHPAWAVGETVMPPVWLNPRIVREKFWKNFTSVARVLLGFDKLIELAAKGTNVNIKETRE